MHFVGNLNRAEPHPLPSPNSGSLFLDLAFPAFFGSKGETALLKSVKLPNLCENHFPSCYPPAPRFVSHKKARWFLRLWQAYNAASRWETKLFSIVLQLLSRQTHHARSSWLSGGCLWNNRTLWQQGMNKAVWKSVDAAWKNVFLRIFYSRNEMT